MIMFRRFRTPILGGSLFVLLAAVYAFWQLVGGPSPATSVEPSQNEARAMAVVDTDQDGLADSWERRYFGSLRYDGDDDPDRDALNNRDEYLRGPAFRPNRNTTLVPNQDHRLQVTTAGQMSPGAAIDQAK